MKWSTPKPQPPASTSNEVIIERIHDAWEAHVASGGGSEMTATFSKLVPELRDEEPLDFHALATILSSKLPGSFKLRGASHWDRGDTFFLIYTP